jgi:serine/threonine protein kinase
MLHVSPYDDSLSTLEGAVIASNVQPGVSYRLTGVLGGGGMSVAFAALRQAADGQTHVVLKILRPAVAWDSTGTAALGVQKEAVALGRLNERVPPTPFVVRLVDAGSVAAHDGVRALELPWLAIEHVQGGIEGTTLDERVIHSVRHTGAGFDLERAANAIRCLAGGLAAIHEVGVLHRDLKPTNVLCCGSGPDEIFKIADFGIARPRGMAATFGIAIGTPGYASPELFLADEPRIGPHSDVFGLAAMIYHLLTGEAYFAVRTPVDGLMLVQRPERRRLADALGLSPELRARPTACATIDAALARATAANPDHRPQSADVLAAMLLPALRSEGPRTRTVERRAKSLLGRAVTLVGGIQWTVRHRPDGGPVIRSAAWDSDGRCLAGTSAGLAFWSGTSWQRPILPDLPDPESIHFVRRMGAGVWLLGGDGARVFRYDAAGVSTLLVGRDPEVRFVLAGGDVADLAVFVGLRAGEPPTLHGVAAGHWIKPAALPRAASITSIAQLDEERWVITGRSTSAEGFAVVYTPLMWEVTRLRTPAVRVYLASATRPELGLGILAGTDGQIVRFEGDSLSQVVLEGAPDLAAAAIDPEGRAWVASMGGIWTADPDHPMDFRRVYRDPSATAPFVSLFADVGAVIAMTADGGILEGRLSRGG